MSNDDMKVLTVMTRKGGAGKTTLCQALLSAAVKNKLRCLALDADPQQGLHRWLHNKCADEPLVEARQLEYAADLESVTEEAYESGDYDLVVVDTQGAAGAWADILAAHSDHLVVPMLLSDKDLSITSDTYNWYVKLRDRVDDPELLPTFRVILSAVKTKTTKTQQEVEKEALTRFPVMDNYFMERNAHLDADRYGFLHVQADERRNSRLALARSHAKRFDEAVEEAVDILNEIMGAN